MTRKRIPKESPARIPAANVEHYSVGTGMTERKKWRISPSGPKGEAAYQALLPSPAEDAFEERMFSAEKEAKRILEGAKLPTDPGGLYTIPGGERVTLPSPGSVGRLMNLIEARGYRERECIEWYAAEILTNILIVRNFIAEGNAAQAAAFGAELGALVCEASLKFNFEADALRGVATLKGARSKKPLRRIQALQGYIAKRRKEEDLTFESFLEELSTRDDGDPVYFADAEIWTEDGKVFVHNAGKDYSLSFRSLERYWKDPPTRAE